MSPLKEIHFFSKDYNYRKGIKFYLSFFKNCPEHKKTGEFSTDYMLSPIVPNLIHKHFPNVKLIACLRNPVDKLHSLYQYQVNRKSQLSIFKNFLELTKKNTAFLEEGCYYKQLKPYFQLFPKKNILILLFDDLKKDPIKFIKNIYKFLELKNLDFIPPNFLQKRNVSGVKVGTNKIPFINLIIYRISFVLGRFDKLRQIFRKVRLAELLEKFIASNIKLELSNLNNEKEIHHFPPLEEKDKKFLKNFFKKDIEKLEFLIEKNLECWK